MDDTTFLSTIQQSIALLGKLVYPQQENFRQLSPVTDLFSVVCNLPISHHVMFFRELLLFLMF